MSIDYGTVNPFASQPARAVWIEIRRDPWPEREEQSQPARAVWIEMCRGGMSGNSGSASQPARAVWIEILPVPNHTAYQLRSQPARAVWIEISPPAKSPNSTTRHSLRGLCGLKFDAI